MNDDFDINDGLIALLIDENFRKRYGTTPDWALKDGLWGKITWFVWYEICGGKRLIKRERLYAQGAFDYIKSFQKIHARVLEHKL